MKEVKTSLYNSVEIADDKAKYDENVKNILANKIILAWILKYSVKEFMEDDIDKIVSLIEGEPEVAKVSILPGKTNKNTKIIGDSNEDKIPNEGEIKFDIRFNVYTSGCEKIKLIVNVEAQKKYNPGYDLVTRGVFYGARLLSSQLDREFSTEDYNDIKKVYSIWICMEAPEYAQNTITSYGIKQEKIYGDFSGKARYDLLEVIMICLGKSYTSNKETLVEMLNVLLSSKIDVKDKMDILSKQFGIESTIKMKKELRQMCNLSDLVEEEAIERGLKKGMQQGMQQGIQQGMTLGKARMLVDMVDNFVTKNSVSFEKALDMLSVTQQEYNEAKAICEE